MLRDFRLRYERDDLPKRLRALAVMTRRATELWGQARGEASDLRGCCAIASAAFMNAAQGAGIAAALVWGQCWLAGHAEPHYWIVALHEGDMCIVDLTATQFLPDAPSVALCMCDDPAAMLYRASQTHSMLDWELSMQFEYLLYGAEVFELMLDTYGVPDAAMEVA